MKLPVLRKLRVSDLIEEPFRLFFPAAVIAGLLGVAVWPLYFAGVLELYPGSSHTRLMGQGFFGGFIFGFLGTSLPRMLSTKPFRSWQIGGVLGLFLCFTGANFAGYVFVGDAAFLMLLVLFLGAVLVRLATRGDVPPPGFVLVGLAFLCGITGTLIGLLDNWVELDSQWLVLRPLLAYQGFVLLPMLGVGAFILPRLLDLPNTQSLPESVNPPAGWWPKAMFALAVGVLVIVTFVVEVKDRYVLAHWLRAGVAAVYILSTVPVHRAGLSGNSIRWSLRVGLSMIVLGLLAVAIWPAYRVGLLHILLVGGLGVVTMVVATRVVFGHSGNHALLTKRNGWLWWALALVLLGMASRISGDFLPHILISHYNYGALCWALGLGIWAWKVLPKVLVTTEE